MNHEMRVRDVYDGCYRRLVAQLFVVCGDLSEAEDAVQEAFVRAIAKPRQFGRLDNPEAWLRTVAINVVRRRFRRVTVFRGIAAGIGPPADVPGLSADHVALVDALRQLPYEQREAIALHTWSICRFGTWPTCSGCRTAPSRPGSLVAGPGSHHS